MQREVETTWSISRMRLACVVVAVLVALPGLGAAQPVAVPLPPDLAVETPGSGVPPDVARFAGAWGNGAWDGVLAHVLVVEQVGVDGQARVAYGYGDAPDWNVSRGYTRVTARVEGGVLALDLPGGRAKVQYHVEGNSLRGTYTIGDRVSAVMLART